MAESSNNLDSIFEQITKLADECLETDSKSHITSKKCALLVKSTKAPSGTISTFTQLQDTSQ